MMAASHKRAWITVLKFALGVGVIAFVLTRIEFEDLARTLKQASLAGVIAALVLFLLNRVLTAVKWGRLLAHAGTPVPLPQLIRVMFVSGFIGSALPSGAGVDIVRFFQLRGKSDDSTAVAGSILADRVLSVLALALLSLPASAIAWRVVADGRLMGSVVILSILLIVGIAVAMAQWSSRACAGIYRWKRKMFLGLGAAESGRAVRSIDLVYSKFERVHRSFVALGCKKGLLFSVLGLNLIVQFVRVAQIHFLFRAVGADPAWIFELSFIPIIIFVTLLPVMPAMGLGVKEGFFMTFFGTVGVTPAAAVSASLLSHLVVLAGQLPGALLFFTRARDPEGRSQ